MKTSVIVRLQVEGFHCFPKAAELFPKVAFLAYRHRHMFHFEVKKEVFHDDRDVEFILFKRDILEYLYGKYYDVNTRAYEFGSMSCEMIAREILNIFNCLSVTVWEDSENGASVEA